MPTVDDLKQSMCASLTQMGDNHYQLGQMEKAVEYYRQALGIAREVNEVPTQRRVLVSLALTAARQSDYNRAVDYYAQALGIGERPVPGSGQPSGGSEVQLLLDLGREFYRQSDLDRAQSHLTAAADYAKQMRVAGDRTAERMENMAHAYLGIIACGHGKIEQIHEHSPAALVYAQGVSDDLLIGVALTGMGLYHALSGELPRASTSLQSAVDKLRGTREAWLGAEALAYLCFSLAEAGQPDAALTMVPMLPSRDDSTVSRRARCVALTAQGMAEAMTAQSDQALVTCRDALTLAQDLLQRGDQVGDWMAARALYGLGIANTTSGTIDDALAAFRQAMALTDSGGDATLHVRAMVGEGEVLLRRNPQEARLTFDHAYTLAQRSRHPTIEILALGGLGQATAAMGRLKDAVTLFEKAYALADKHSDMPAQFRIAMLSGDAHRAAGRRDVSVDNYEQALQLARTIGVKRLEAQALGGIGMCLIDGHDARKAVKAIKYLTDAEAAAREAGNLQLTQLYFGALGSAYATSGQTVKAIDHYRQAVANARDVGDRAGEGIWMGNLANLYAYLNQPERAIEAYQKAIEISKETGDRRGQGRLMVNMALVYSDLDQFGEAVNVLRDARTLFDTLGDGEMLAQTETLLSQMGG